MKLAGIILLSLVPAVIGFVRGEAIRKEEQRIAALLAFLEYIQFEIETFLRKQRDIFRSFENGLLESDGFLPRLRLLADSDPVNALRRAVDEYLPSLSLGKRGAEALRDFADSFGTVSKEKQLLACRKVIAETAVCRKEKKDRIENKIKISRLVGLAIGLGFFIIMI